MTTGKEAFESACQIGVAKSYNYRQLSQVFYGIDQAIQEIASSGGGNIVISGSQPDGEEEGQIAFFQGVDGNYYEYIWVGGSWVNVKTQNDDVTVAGSAPFITISGTEIETQRDINHYLNDKIESLILDPSGEPIDLAPFATIEYSDAEDAKLQAQIDALTPETDLGPPTTVQRLYRFSRTTVNNGEMFGSTDNAELLNTLVFADKDAANQDKPVFSEGDEVSFGGWTYKFTDSSGKLEYVSGPGGTISVGTRYTVTFTIYPTGIASRVAAGEETQTQIIATISGALETQSGLITQISGINLETVLTNGNIADKELFLTNGDTSLIDLSPVENVIGIAGNGDSTNPRIRVAHLDENNYRDSFAQLELDENGTRFDFEFNEKIDNVHFRFEDAEKLVLNKTGAAEFKGQVTVLPAEQVEQAATLGQVIAYIAGLQAEIDQISNSVEAGVWVHDDGDHHVDSGEYQLWSVQTQESYDAALLPLQEDFNQCMTDAGGQGPAMSECQRVYTEAANAVPEVGEKVYTDEWQYANTIQFAYLDADGEGFTFDNVSVGQYIDVVCEDGSGQMLGLITKVTTGYWYEDNIFEYTTISYKGKANGRTRVKIFSVNDDASGDLTNFVHKTGDTLTGELKFNIGTNGKGITMQKDGEDRLYLENNGNETRFRVPRNKPFKFVGYNPDGAAQQIIKIYGYNEEQATNPDLEDNNGRLGLFNLIDPTSDRMAVSLGYMRDFVDSHFSGFSGEYLRLDGGAMSGNLVMTGAGIYTDAIIKSTRTSGYAFQVHNEAEDTNPAFIHSNGNIRGAAGTFTSDVEIRGATTFKGGTTFESTLNFEGAWISGNLGLHSAGKGIRFYNDDKSTHFADITRQGIVLENKIYADNLWTLKVQDANDADSKTLIYADYSSGLILNDVGELNLKGRIRTESNLVFAGAEGAIIDVTSGNPGLSGRASLDIKTAADYPVVISSGSGYKKVFAIYGYDGDQDDNRGEVACINANGNAYFGDVFSNDEKLATESFVNAGGGMRWRHADHEVAGDLTAGEFFVASNGNIYLHPTSYDGVDLAPSSTATEVTGIKQLATVHRPNGESAYFITWTGINFNNGSNKYIRVNKDATHLGDSTSPGILYRLNIPGFTF